MSAPVMDLQNFPYMPLYIGRLQKSKAWLACKRDPALAFYMMNLWMRAWHEVPAGSIENDDDVLADAAMCDPDKWSLIKEKVLRGWYVGEDMRLYHSTVTEVAKASWTGKQEQKQRTQAARDAKRQHRDKSVTTSVTGNATIPDTADAADMSGDNTENVTGSNREEGRIRDIKIPPSEGAGAVPDAKAILWKDGLATLKAITGYADGPARKQIGKLVETIKGDHAALMDLILEAEKKAVDQPLAWITGAINARHAPSLPLEPPTEGYDPWGLYGWAKRCGGAPGVHNGRETWFINGFCVQTIGELIVNACKARIVPNANWDALSGWCRDDIPYNDGWLSAITRVSERLPDSVRSLAVFDSAVRGVAKMAA